MAQWIVPLLVGDKMIAQGLGYLVKDAPKLDFIPLRSRQGTMGWNDEKPDSTSKYLRPMDFRFWRPLVLAMACVLLLLWMSWRTGFRVAGL